jgi:hypothetical protein
MRPARAILLGTLIVGTLDALDAILYTFWRSGASPVRVFQGVASGLLGRESFQGGLAAAALGLAIHYFIACSIVTVYLAASRFVPLLTRRPVLCGIVYGVGVYVFMNRAVIPLSAIGPQPFLWPSFINGILIHVLGIGIPAALVAAAVRPRSPR